MKKIGVLGSIAVDNIFEASSIPAKGERIFGSLLGSFPGGIGANQALEMARYLNTVYMLGNIGNDPAGQRMSDAFTERGVKLDLLDITETDFTGQSYMYLIDNRNDYFSVVTPNANFSIESKSVAKKMDFIDTLVVSLEINEEAALAAVHAAKAKGKYIYLIPSPAENCSKEILSMADAVICNRREAELLLNICADSIEEIMGALRKRAEMYDLILISLGENGAVCGFQDKVFHVQALKVNPVDTVGAGDALCGAFIAAREYGLDLYKAVCFGCIAGGLTVTFKGAQTSGHDKEKLEGIYSEFYKGKDFI